MNVFSLVKKVGLIICIKVDCVSGFGVVVFVWFLFDSFCFSRLIISVRLKFLCFFNVLFSGISELLCFVILCGLFVGVFLVVRFYFLG